MASLTGKTIASTYKDLLQIQTSVANSGIDGTVRTIQDGDGTNSALQISNAAVNINGTLQLNGTAITKTAEQINAITDISNITGVAVGNAGTVVGRTLTGSTGISVTNADGTAGNPTFALENTSVSAGTYTGGSTFTVDAQGRITDVTATTTISAAAFVGGTLSGSSLYVENNVSVSGALNVAGNVSVAGTMHVDGTTSISNDLNISGTFTAAGPVISKNITTSIVSATFLYGDGSNITGLAGAGTMTALNTGTGIYLTENGVTTTGITGSGTLALFANQEFGTVSATTINVSNNLIVNGSATFADNIPLHFGTDKDLTIQHNGSNSLITESGTGSLFVQSNDIRLTNTGSFSMLTLTDGQDADFPYGVQVSGTVSATSFVGPTITSINNVIAGVSSTMATSIDNTNSNITALSATLATSIDNTNSNVTALSATLATSIANHLPLAGGTMTGAITLPGNPSANLEAATKQYVDNLTAAAIHFHSPVRVESPDSAGNLNATYNNGTAGVGATLTNAGTQAALVIDGVTLNTSDRVLIYNQTDATQNGVYTVTDTGSVSTNWVLTRATDADSYAPATNDGLDGGSYFYVQEGTEGAGEAYVCNNIGEITFGTTDITFVQFSSALVYTAGSGININSSRVVSTSGVPTDAELATVSATLATSISNHMPLAGGTFTGSIDVTGTVTAQLLDLGTNNPRIRFDDSDTSNNGEITLDNTSLRIEADEDNAVADSKISFRVDASEKAFINSSGLDVTGTITFDGGTTSDDLNFGDNDKASFSSGKLQIYHDGTNAYIDETYANGTFLIRGNNIALQKYTGETMIQCVSDGKVELNFNNVPKLETTATGVTVTGTAIASTQTASVSGNTTLDFGAYQNFVLTMTGNVTLDNPTTEQVGQSGFITFIQTGGYTVSLGTDYETAGGAGITLSASGTDVVPYIVIASGRILLGTPQLAFA